MSKQTTVEKVWKTKAGFQALIINCRGSHYCGYVGLKDTHPLYELDYGTNSPYIKDITAEETLGDRSPMVALFSKDKATAPQVAYDVHGGITFSDRIEHLEGADPKLWYFGFDCAHYQDGKLDEWNGYEPKSIEFCVGQCESLAQQIIDKLVTSND